MREFDKGWKLVNKILSLCVNVKCQDQLGRGMHKVHPWCWTWSWREGGEGRMFSSPRINTQLTLKDS